VRIASLTSLNVIPSPPTSAISDVSCEVVTALPPLRGERSHWVAAKQFEATSLFYCATALLRYCATALNYYASTIASRKRLMSA
jgi:nitrate reductase alpha subunit